MMIWNVICLDVLIDGNYVDIKVEMLIMVYYEIF